MIKAIVAGFTVPGFHVYQHAPQEVDFLGDIHRHLFHIKVFCLVKHNNRELEFLIVRGRVLDWLKTMYPMSGGKKYDVGSDALFFGGMSCEMIATKILEAFRPVYNCFKVEVWEDGENGAIVADFTSAEAQILSGAPDSM